MEGMAKPIKIRMLSLKRLVRYIARCPSETYVFEHQDMPSRHVVQAGQRAVGDLCGNGLLPESHLHGQFPFLVKINIGKIW